MESTKEMFNFKVTWQPFLLRPNLPLEGAPKPEGYSRNSPGAQRLINIGKDVGVDFAYKLQRWPNTILGHCALEFALEKDQTGKTQNELQEKLFKSYFTDGEYPDAEVVSKLASECGLQVDEVKSYISDHSIQEKIKVKAMKHSMDGINGVPFFIINGRGMISGAQEPETLVHAFKKANEKFPVNPSM